MVPLRCPRPNCTMVHRHAAESTVALDARNYNGSRLNQLAVMLAHAMTPTADEVRRTTMRWSNGFSHSNLALTQRAAVQEQATVCQPYDQRRLKAGRSLIE